MNRLIPKPGDLIQVTPEELDGLEHGGSGIDVFWCWADYPRAGGGIERPVTIAIWRCQLLIDRHHRLCREFLKGGER